MRKRREGWSSYYFEKRRLPVTGTRTGTLIADAAKLKINFPIGVCLSEKPASQYCSTVTNKSQSNHYLHSHQAMIGIAPLTVGSSASESSQDESINTAAELVQENDSRPPPSTENDHPNRDVMVDTSALDNVEASYSESGRRDSFISNISDLEHLTVQRRSSLRLPSTNNQSRRHVSGVGFDTSDLHEAIRQVQEEEAKGADGKDKEPESQEAGKLRRPSYQMRSSLTIRRPSFSARRSSFKKTPGSVDMDTNHFHAAILKVQDNEAIDPTSEADHVDHGSGGVTVPRRRPSLLSQDYRIQRKKNLNGRGCSFSQNVLVETYDADMEIQAAQPVKRGLSLARRPSLMNGNNLQQSCSSIDPTAIEEAIRQVQEEDSKIGVHNIADGPRALLQQRRVPSQSTLGEKPVPDMTDSSRSIGSKSSVVSDVGSLSNVSFSRRNWFKNQKMKRSDLSITDCDSIETFQTRDDDFLSSRRNVVQKANVPVQPHLAEQKQSNTLGSGISRPREQTGAPASLSLPLFGGAPALSTERPHRLDSAIRRFRSIKLTAATCFQLFVILTVSVSYAGYFRSNSLHGSLRGIAESNGAVKDEVSNIIEGLKNTERMVQLLQSEVSDLYEANEVLQNSAVESHTNYGMYDRSMEVMNTNSKLAEKIDVIKSESSRLTEEMKKLADSIQLEAYRQVYER